MASAQFNAVIGLANLARKPWPVVLIKRPWWSGHLRLDHLAPQRAYRAVGNASV
jgi:hypothetical protein